MHLLPYNLCTHCADPTFFNCISLNHIIFELSKFRLQIHVTGTRTYITISIIEQLLFSWCAYPYTGRCDKRHRKHSIYEYIWTKCVMIWMLFCMVNIICCVVKFCCWFIYKICDILRRHEYIMSHYHQITIRTYKWVELTCHCATLGLNIMISGIIGTEARGFYE